MFVVMLLSGDLVLVNELLSYVLLYKRRS